jgi:hypothetical protein
MPQKGVNIMKKAAIIITLAAAMVTLTSCSRQMHITSNLDASYQNSANTSESVAEKTEKATAPTIQNETTTVASGEEAVQTKETAEAASDAAVQTTENDHISQSAAQVMETAFNKGKIVGNAYISELAGLKLVFPENAELYGKDALYTNFMMPTRFMTDEEKEHYMTGVIDFSVSFGEASKVNVWYYDLKQRYPETPDMTPEEYLQLELANSNNSFTVTDICGPEKITLGGNEYTKISYTCESFPTIKYARNIDADNIIVIEVSGASASDIESRFETIS